MKKSEIKVGGVYVARVSGNFVNVRVDAIRERLDHKGRDVTVYDVTNLKTNRRTTFRSAAKFRSEVIENGRRPIPAAVQDAIKRTAPELAKALGYETTAFVTTNGYDTSVAEDEDTSSFADDVAAEAAAPVPAFDAAADVSDVGEVAGYTPTPEQAAIIRTVRQPGLKVLVVEAGAGTGKTSTLRMIEEVLPGVGQYTAFNKSLVNESKAKFKRASCKTTHGLAFMAEGRRFKARLDNRARVRSDALARMVGINAELVLDLGPNPKHDPANPKSPARLTKRLQPDFLMGQVTAAIRRFCQSADREINAGHFKYIDGIDTHGADGKRSWANNELVREHLLPFARKAWADYNNPDGTLPGYQHDYYVKTWALGKPFVAADYILLDESQDSAPVLVDILKRQTHALLILVGDGCQRIYGWRGAINAGDEFPDAPRTYLSQSFRFGPAVAAVANAILDTLTEPAVLRLKGLSSIASHVYVNRPSPLPPTCVLCRTNAAAVGHLLAGIEQKRRVHLIGGGEDVVRFVEAADDLQHGRGTSHPDLACFESWAEVVAYSQEDEGEDLALMVKIVEEFGCDVILQALRNMPAERDADLVVCTAHKSKGREWSRVKLASDFPSADKMSDEDRRLLYVAATRAKHVLDLSECPPFAGGKRRANEGWNGEGSALPVIHVSFTNPDGPPTDCEEPAAAVVEAATAPTTAAAPSSVPNGNGAPTKFTWSKTRDGGWGVRGPAGKRAGEEVTVEKRDGRTSREQIREVLWQGDGAALYTVK